jgi:hypothetical protein
LIALYLIACSLLLAQGAAVDNKSETIDDLLAMNLSNQTTMNRTVFNSSDLNSSEFAFTDQDIADNYYNYSQITNEPEVISLAFPASDFNGDNATDLLVMNISSDAETGAFNSEISAFSGADGSILWQKEYPSSLVFATTAGDLNGDGQTDVMIDEILAAASFIPYSSVSALDGSNGTAIWSRSRLLAMTFAYPVQDISGDNATQFLVHVFGLDSMNSSMFTSIARVSGANGTKLDERIFAGPALAVPVLDLTGDGRNELVVYLMRFAENDSISCDIAVLQGSDGLLLWKRSFSGLIYAVAGPDLTGEGQRDLMVYKLGESDSSEVLAVKGDDGRLLWRKEGMIVIPP